MFLNGLYVSHYRTEETVNGYALTGTFALLSAYFQKYHLIDQHIFSVLFPKCFINNVK